MPVFKGTYPETLTAAIAAWRAGQAPHLVQMFEVGTGSMLAAGPAVKQVWQLVKETGVALDPDAYIPAVRGYYSLPDGRLASAPFNSSTAVHVAQPGRVREGRARPDASRPRPGPSSSQACAGAEGEERRRRSPMTTSWFTWIQLEQFAAMHNLPFATKANGFEGLDARAARSTSRPSSSSSSRLLDMAKDGHVQIRRPRQRARPAVLLRRGGDQLQLVRARAATSSRTPSSSGARRCCRMTPS